MSFATCSGVYLRLSDGFNAIEQLRRRPSIRGSPVDPARHLGLRVEAYI